ncbi:DNA alkylation repair protein [Nonomuraea sp. NPDC050310]|uniref:DNA alkylation repair protein n=1 Tax=Nonomuraea sp. NPDC050310 TaxID=3154935 RepID=UPI003403DDD7
MSPVEDVALRGLTVAGADGYHWIYLAAEHHPHSWPVTLDGTRPSFNLLSRHDSIGPAHARGGAMTARITADDVALRLEAAADEAERARIRKRLSDPVIQVLGVRMGSVFDIARLAQGMELAQVHLLLDSDVYEMRMVAAAVLDFKTRGRGVSEEDRTALYEVMMSRIDRFNTWDLIDRAAPRVVGWYLLDKPRDVLFDLARSDDRWRRRLAITAAFWIIRQGDLDDPLMLCTLLAGDPERLVQTNVGVALREIGRVDSQRLTRFLDQHEGELSAVARRTARTALTTA